MLLVEKRRRRLYGLEHSKYKVGEVVAIAQKIIVMSNKKGILSIQGNDALELRIGEMAKMVY